MHDGVQRAARTVVVLSPGYLASVYGAAEWQAAWRQDPLGEQRKLVVVRVAEIPRPGLLAGVVSIDLFDAAEPVARERLRAAGAGVVAGRAKPATKPTFPAEPRSPGPGDLPGGELPGGELPEVWNLPPRNPGFIARGGELEQIRVNLAAGSVATVQAVR